MKTLQHRIIVCPAAALHLVKKVIFPCPECFLHFVTFRRRALRSKSTTIRSIAEHFKCNKDLDYMSFYVEHPIDDRKALRAVYTMITAKSVPDPNFQ